MLHLCDEVNVDVHTVDGNGLLIADAEDVTKTFGGPVGRRPGPTAMLAVRPDQPLE
jgi:hypothetical protein